MRGSKHYLDAFATLHELPNADELRATWRQSMATLAEATLESRGVPLEGLHPDQLLAGVRVAMASNLMDDLGFLSAPAAACALYGLASALPHGAERRELGRRVLLRLHESDAATFVSLATAVALGSTRAFEGAAMRARVGLSLVLPIGTGTPADALALALISRRELAQRWLVEPSTGSLPARRMAARLLERAAREAARRAAQGDDGGLGLFDSHMVQTAWNYLMSDREPLVWRHIATGRGLLSAVMPRFTEEVERDLLATASFSRWRRGATSLAARVALRPNEAVARARDVLGGSLLGRDPGMAAAMIYGLPRAAEVEPDAAEELLMAATERGGVLAAEALVDLRREWFGSSFGLKAAEVARVQLRQKHGGDSSDDGQVALIDVLCEELGERGEDRAPSLPDRVFKALSAFGNKSARAAYEQAREALGVASELLKRLESLNESEGTKARHESFRLMHELDVGLLESSILSDLLSLGAQGNDTSKTVAPLTALMTRLNTNMMTYETAPHMGGETVPHLTLRMRRLRTLLHLLDLDTRQGDERTSPGGDPRVQRLDTIRRLFERVRDDASSPMDRIVHASVARGCDSLVRDEIFELSDVVLAAAANVPTPEGFAALSEGSMLPEVKLCLKALAGLVRTLFKAGRDSGGQQALMDALVELSHALPAESSPRTEGLRSNLLRLARALRFVGQARSLREIAQEQRAMELLEIAVDELVHLAAGARRRLNSRGPISSPNAGEAVSTLGLAVERAVQDQDDSRAAIEVALDALDQSLRAELPPMFGGLIMNILRPLADRPLEAPKVTRNSGVQAPVPVEDRPLPAWLPPARTLGGFFVVRALGAGAGGSVFVVKRSEERNEPRAPQLALKVPEYDGSAARSLSEEEFLRMFRQEAGALLAIPPHENLASFVTFDAGAKPKPVLVMELVEGPTLERVLAKGDMDCTRGVSLIDGMLSGLEAMHAVGVGHLDVKPSNVILRERETLPTQPVLVDFGLAGRHVRPGCATGNYGAPEIWGLVPDGITPSPMSADVYALGCVAYEVMTGQTLFSAASEMAMIAAHVSHDGRPAPVAALAAEKDTAPFADWLARCLRQDPRERASVRELRQGLRGLKESLKGCEWPMPLPAEV
ncbi:MAG: serine/threonine-protein kinase [Myxococcales bacterium]